MGGCSSFFIYNRFFKFDILENLFLTLNKLICILAERIKISKMKIILFIVLLLPVSIRGQWEQISTIGNFELRGVKFLNEHTGIVVGQGGIWRSTNSGVSWTQVLNGQNMNAISFPDNNVGYAVGDSGRIYKTSDFGLNWTTQITNTLNNLNSISFYNVSTGYTVGQSGIILRTTSGGTNWYQNVSQTTQDLNCVQAVINGNSAFAVGSNTSEYFTSTANGGANWISTLMIPNNSLQSLNYIPGLNGNIICVGGNGRIRKTTNFGGSWTLITTSVTNNFNEVVFLDANTGYIVGGVSVILKTTNSGLNWTLQSTPSSSTLLSINFINLNTGWAVGAFGNVLRTGIPVAIPHNSRETPIAFKLFQNYPNPFNPYTKINVEVPESAVISITVYDFSGKEVSTVIANKLMNIGKYEFGLNMVNFSSGIYICQFEAKLFSEHINKSIKILLIK